MNQIGEMEDNVDILDLDELEQWLFNSVVCPDIARRKREVLGVMEKVFEPIIKSNKQQNNFEWALIKNIYNDYKNLMTNVWSLRMFCDFVFKLLYKFNCSNDQLIIEIIHMYRQVLNEYESLDLCQNCLHMNYPKHYCYEEIIDVLRVAPFKEEMKSIYRFTNHEFYSKLTIDAIYTGDYVSLQFLIKYGLSYFPNDEINQAKVELQKLYCKYFYLKRLAGNDNEINEKDHFAGSVVERFLVEIENPNLRRIILIIRAVNISLCKPLGDNYYPDYVKCLNFYALTVPEATISMKDVEDFLDFAFIDDRIFITETCFNFKEVFPESPSFSSPRSLKYLSRCKVRNCVKKFTSFTTILSYMHIPFTLKDYLLFLSD